MRRFLPLILALLALFALTLSGCGRSVLGVPDPTADGGVPDVGLDLDIPDLPEPFCGDMVCGFGENCDTCAVDCGACMGCGNNFCDSTESCVTCPDDCGLCPDCGDSTCGPAENCENCQVDCGSSARALGMAICLSWSPAPAGTWNGEGGGGTARSTRAA